METRGHRVNVQFDVQGFNTIMDLPPLEWQDDETVNITCGVLEAKLHKERFICPGINRDCIEFMGQFITPKTFYVMAEKGSLKDWKTAIRINGKKIRRYIDSGELNFYNHDKLCTGRCKSRTKFAPDATLVNMQASLTSSSSTPAQLTSLRQAEKRTLELLNGSLSGSAEGQDLDSYGEERDVKPDMARLQFLQGLNLTPDSHAGAGNQDSDPAEETGAGDSRIQLLQNSDSNDDDVCFWKAIVQLGLVDEFFREVKAKLDSLKSDLVLKCVQSTEAKKASRIVNELGMREKLDLKLFAHKYEFDRQRQRLEKEMEILKKKVCEYESKSEQLKRKSDCYQQLMTKKLRLDEIPAGENDDSEVSGSQSTSSPVFPSFQRVEDAASPSSGVMMNGDSRSTSPYPSQDSTNTTGSVDSSIDSAFVASQEGAT